MDGQIDQFDLWTGLFGGLALFLFGMDLLTLALKRAAGDRMRDLLGKVTRNRFLGAAAGALITGVVNSSSVTTVILVGFISAGLMSMSQSVSVIMGANIGSTFTAQVLAFNVTRYALPIITAGFLISFLSKHENRREYGRFILGIGLVFYGMGLMSQAMVPLRSYQPFVDLISTLASPLLAVVVGAVFTAIIQSSAATTGIVIVLAGQGLLALETAIPIALGANIGTCVTAGLASIGKPREAVRAVLVHVLFNVAGVLLWIGFIPEFATLVRTVSPVAEGLSGAVQIAAEAPRQVANAHTIFNVANTLLFIGFTAQIARLVAWLVPDRPLRIEQPLAPKFLEESLLPTPALALSAARSEIGRMGDYVHGMLIKALPAAISGSREALRMIEAMDKPVDRLHKALIGYLGRISTTALTPVQAAELMQIVGIANDLEHIGDRIAGDLTTSARKRLDEHAAIAPEAIDRITNYHAAVAQALREAIQAVTDEDTDLASSVRAMKHDVNAIADKLHRERFHSLPGLRPGSVTAYVREVEVLEILDGIFKVARRIARSQLIVAEEPDAST